MEAVGGAGVDAGRGGGDVGGVEDVHLAEVGLCVFAGGGAAVVRFGGVAVFCEVRGGWWWCVLAVGGGEGSGQGVVFCVEGV